MHLDWMALGVTTGFLMALSAAGAMYYSIAGTAIGEARRLRRRLAPSPDLPDLVARKDKVARVLARGLTPLARLAAPLKEDELSSVRRKLVQGGFRSPYVVQFFLAAKVVVALIALGALGPEERAALTPVLPRRFRKA